MIYPEFLAYHSLRFILTLAFFLLLSRAYSQKETLELTANLNTISETHAAIQSDNLFTTSRSYIETGLSVLLPINKNTTFQLSTQYIQGAGAIKGMNSDPSLLGVIRLYYSL